MKNLLFISLTFFALTFAACGHGTSVKQMSAADSIRLQDSLEALKQAEQETLDILQAEKAAEQASKAAAERAKK
jgi:hypothetical protein